jgi:hypothetical protein
MYFFLREGIDYYCVRNTRTFMRALNVKREREKEGLKKKFMRGRKAREKAYFLREEECKYQDKTT